MSHVHVALFTPGYPHVDAVIRAIELSRRHGGAFSRSVGEPLSLQRDRFARWFLTSEATHALMLEGDVVPPEDAIDRLLAADAPVATAAYLHFSDGRLCANVQRDTDPTWPSTIVAESFAIRRCLLGCVLVRRDVFAALRSPWFLSTMKSGHFITDDEWFSAAVRRAGLAMVCDGGVVCTSLRQGTDLRVLASAQAQA